MGDLHVAGTRELDAAQTRGVQRRAAGVDNPLLGLQAQAGNAAVSRMISENAQQVQRSCSCGGGGGCSCGPGEQAEGAEAQAGPHGAELGAAQGSQS